MFDTTLLRSGTPDGDTETDETCKGVDVLADDTDRVGVDVGVILVDAAIDGAEGIGDGDGAGDGDSEGVNDSVTANARPITGCKVVATSHRPRAREGREGRVPIHGRAKAAQHQPCMDPTTRAQTRMSRRRDIVRQPATWSSAAGVDKGSRDDAPRFRWRPRTGSRVPLPCVSLP